MIEFLLKVSHTTYLISNDKPSPFTCYDSTTTYLLRFVPILFILLGYSARPIGYMPKKSYICEFSLARRVNKCIVPKHNKLENYLAISRLPKIVATLSSSVL